MAEIIGTPYDDNFLSLTPWITGPLIGTEDADFIYGLQGFDDLVGRGGNDYLDGGLHFDNMAGGSGSDTYVVDNTLDDVDEISDHSNLQDNTLQNDANDTVLSYVDFTLPTNVEHLTLIEGSSARNGFGNELDNHIIGNSIAVAGPQFGNFLAGLDGDDIIEGLAGDDVLVGNDGDDDLFGGSDNDRLHGDDVDGSGFGSDYLDGGTGADEMHGGAGSDIYVVDNADDAVIEEGGAEDIDVVWSSLTFTLRPSVENLTLLENGGAIDGTGNGNGNLINGNNSDNTLNGLGGNDTLKGGGGADILNGGSEADTLRGDQGNDELDGGSGADDMTGGLDDDTYIVDHADDVVREAAERGVDTVKSLISFELPVNVENLELIDERFSDGDGEFGIGNDLNNDILGNVGGNTLSGLGGADDINGRGGNDTIDGGFGNDVLDGAENVDTVSFESWDPTGPYLAALESIVIQLQQGNTAGTATWSITNSFTGVTSVFETDTLLGFEHVRGSNRTETIVGNTGNNVLEGRDGNDTLEGGAGRDTLDGGAGIDMASYANAASRVVVMLRDGADGTGVEDGVTTDRLRSIENVRGSNFDDEITGNSQANTLDGGSGTDIMTGGAGDDTYIVNTSSDVVIEAKAGGFDKVATLFSYTLAADAEIEVLETTGSTGPLPIDLTGNGGPQTIRGNNGGNTINGLGGVDTLVGNGGGDRLIGGTGRDTMTGGTGADTFLWNSTSETGVTIPTADLITDFNFAQGDRIDLSGVDADVFTAGNQDFRFIGTNAFSGTPGEINYIHVGNETIIQLQTGVSADVEGAIRLSGILTPEASWFVL